MYVVGRQGPLNSRFRKLIFSYSSSFIFFVCFFHCHNYLNSYACTNKIISWNVRFKKSSKAKKHQKCHCYFLQETYSEPKDELIWKSEWGGEMLFSHGTNRHKGGCILLNLSTSNLLIESQYSDVDGRIVLVNISFNSTKVSLWNIYAPNNLDLQLRLTSTSIEF